jgi:hypothetical protein
VIGTCAAPIVLDGTAMLGAETTVGTSNALSAVDPTCLGVATRGPEQVYRVSVPASGTTRLRVTVTPAAPPGRDAFDPVVYLMRDCVVPPVCIAGQDSRGGGSLEVAEHTNTTGFAEDIFVVVDGYDFQPQGGAYRLALEQLNP